jgi:predicted RNA-binding protein with PUA-like domain
MRQYWLMKSEPDEVSIDDALAAPKRTISWFGVRNYQARNFMRDLMKVDDGVLFYHSSCAVPGIAGVARIASAPYPDTTQFDKKSPYFDPKAAPSEPRWTAIDVEALESFPVITLSDLKAEPTLEKMRVLARGNRLSITPVTSDEFRFITTRLSKRAR